MTDITTIVIDGEANTVTAECELSSTLRFDRAIRETRSKMIARALFEEARRLIALSDDELHSLANAADLRATRPTAGAESKR